MDQQLCQYRATLKQVFTNKGFRVYAFSTAQQSGSIEEEETHAISSSVCVNTHTLSEAVFSRLGLPSGGMWQEAGVYVIREGHTGEISGDEWEGRDNAP